MTYELKNIFDAYETSAKANIKAVLATVVALEGSSYRKPGVRMLVLENGMMEGAVSGGCVEKEIVRQAESVFNSGEARVMTYDGRYRLGCEGILYILLEPFAPTEKVLKSFRKVLLERKGFSMESHFLKKEVEDRRFGSTIIFEKDRFSLHPEHSADPSFLSFTQELEPAIQLFVIGSEHDAVTLTSIASQMGIEVAVVANPTEEKSIKNFPGASHYYAITPDSFPIDRIDEQTAVILMNHSFAKDLQFMITLHKCGQFYTGVLGPYQRREDLLNAFLEQCPEAEDAFLDLLHGPAGIDIGAITPQEIAVSILAEVLMVHRNRIPLKLRDKKGSIHSPST